MTHPSRGRTDWALALAVAAAVVACVLAAVSLARDGLPEPARASTDMAALVPANALVYVHTSLDRGRDPVQQLAERAGRFPGYVGLRKRIVRELTSPDCRRATDALKTADDASLSLFQTRSGAAVSLLLIDQGGPRPSPDLQRCGALYAANIGDELAIGQRESLAVAAALQDGRGTSLAASRLAAPQFARLPGDRVVDGWLSVDGVRRLLAPQRGVLGFVGVTLDQPALRGLAFALSPSDTGATLAVRSALDPKGRSTAADQSLDEVLRRLPDGLLAGFAAQRLGSSLDRVGSALGGSGGGASVLSALPRAVIALFDQPTAVALQAATPAPVLTLLTTTSDEAAARRALATMPVKLRAAFPARVKDGYVALATKPSGLRLLDPPADPLQESDRWRATIGSGSPEGASSLLFLDFSKLLALAEQTGLGSDPAYRSVRADLGRITAAGARISSSASESTVDLTLLIP